MASPCPVPAAPATFSADSLGDCPEERAAIARRAGIVAIGTLASRILGAVRDAAIAGYFRVADTDAFVVAWTIPNTLRRVLGEGAVSAAIVPIYNEVRETEGKARAQRYVAAISGVMLLLLSAVSALGVFTSSLWTTLYAAGYRADHAKWETTTLLTQLCFPYLLLVGFAALGMGILNSVGRFAVAAFAPALLNVAVILTPFLFTPIALSLGLPAVAGLAIATLAGGVLHVVVQFPALRREGLLPRPTLAFADPAVKKTLLLMVPLVLGSGIYQLNIMLSRLFASYLPAGAQSFLYYGQRLVEIPQGMFALAVASATLPNLARHKSLGQHDAAKATLRYSLRLSLFIAIPASVALVVLATPTIAVLFGRGEFTDVSVRQTARSLAWMAGSTWAVAAIHPITRMYYAYNDTRTPVWCSALNLVAFASVSFVGMRSYGHVAIAAATSAGAIAQLLGLLVMLPRRVGATGFAEVLRSSLRCLVASLAMGAVIYDVARVATWTQNGSPVRSLITYLAIVPFGALVYFAACSLLRSPELGELRSVLSRRAVRP